MTQFLLQLQLVIAICATAVSMLYFFRRRSPLSHIPGPKSSSWLLGNQVWLRQAAAGAMDTACRAQFGSVYRYSGCFGTAWLMISDPKAMAHVLRGQTTRYCLEDSLREFIRLVAGKGIVYVEGSRHAQQKRIMAPAFQLTSVKKMMPAFYSCGERLVSRLRRIVDESPQSDSVVVNMTEWMSRVTLDAVGEAGFGYRFATLERNEPADELARAYEGMINSAFARPTAASIVIQSLVQLLPAWMIAGADYLPFKRLRNIRRAREVATRYTRDLVSRRRLDITENADNRAVDVLSLLVRANMAEDARIRMNDEEIYAQVTTLLAAGHETSANTMNFLLLEVASNSEVQSRVYAEIRSTLEASQPIHGRMTYETLEEMVFTRAVIKEGMRLNPAIFNGMLQAAEDDVIPLAKPIISVSGKRHDHISIRKGQRINLSFYGFNRLKEIWGKDADEFRPDRWLEKDMDTWGPEDKCSGVFANLANFGGGPRACIAWRFALIEIQIFLIALIREFELTMADTRLVVRKDGCHTTMTPVIEGDLDYGPKLPMRIRARSPNDR